MVLVLFRYRNFAACKSRLSEKAANILGQSGPVNVFSGRGMGSEEGSREKVVEEEEKVDTGLRSRRQGALPLPLPLLRCSNDVFSPSFPPFSLFSARFSNGCRETLL